MGNIGAARVSIILRNSANRGVKYEVRSLHVVIDGKTVTPRYQTGGGDIPTGATTAFTYTDIPGVNLAQNPIAGTIAFEIAYGAANVRPSRVYTHKLTLEVFQTTDGGFNVPWLTIESRDDSLDSADADALERRTRNAITVLTAAQENGVACFKEAMEVFKQSLPGSEWVTARAAGIQMDR